MEKVNVQIYIKSSECELHFSDDKDKTASFLAANSLRRQVYGDECTLRCVFAEARKPSVSIAFDRALETTNNCRLYAHYTTTLIMDNLQHHAALRPDGLRADDMGIARIRALYVDEFQISSFITPKARIQSAAEWTDSNIVDIIGCLSSRNIIVFYTSKAKIWQQKNKTLSYRRDSAHLRSLRLTRSFKVTDFGTNRKPRCDFLLVNDTKLHPISHRFQVISDYWLNFRLQYGGNSL